MMNINFEELIAAARKAAEHSYSPYSHYRVGAALLATDGTVYAGCNVENASYGLTICAERTAIFKAIGEGRREFKALALVAGTKENAGTPCGACRQVLAEFCAPEMPLVCAALDGTIVLRTSVGELLPHGFSKADVQVGADPRVRPGGEDEQSR